MKCLQCGAEAQPRQKFCASCGSPMQSIPQPEISIAATEDKSDLSHPSPQMVPAAPARPPYQAETFAPYQSPAEAAFTGGDKGSHMPFLLVLGIALLVILGTLVAVVLAVSGSRDANGGLLGAVSAPTPTSLSLDSKALLERSAQAMKSLHTLHYQSEAGFYGLNGSGSGVSGAPPISMTLNGDIALPDRYTMNTDAAPLGQFVVIGSDTWNRSNGSRQWLRRPTADAGLGPVNPLAVTSYMQYFKPDSLERISSEMVNGVLLHRIRFDVDTARMASDSAQGSVQDLLLHSRITADAWIRGTDNLLESISIAVDSANGTGVILRSVFSNYNDQVDIKPPDAGSP